MADHAGLAQRQVAGDAGEAQPAQALDGADRHRAVDDGGAGARGPFAVTAVPAVDGFGDPQVSWVVAADGERILHGGDTLFHGAWWSIATRVGPIDTAFLPINAAVCSFPHRQPPSPFPATLDPAHAVAAAQLLRAGRVVPIHYGAIDGPPVYAPRRDALPELLRTAAEHGVPVAVVAPGDSVPAACAVRAARAAAAG